MAGLPAPPAAVHRMDAGYGSGRSRLGRVAHAADLPHPSLPRLGKQAHSRASLREYDRRRELLLRLLEALDGQRVARLPSTHCAQRCLGQFGGVHPHLQPREINEYLVGDNGILILVGTTVAAVWLGRKVNRELRSEAGVGKGEQYVES